MTIRQIVLTAIFAAFWIAFMVWWSGDRSTANILILSVIGVVVAGIWAFAMKRFGQWT